MSKKYFILLFFMEIFPGNHSVNVNRSATTNFVPTIFQGDCRLRVNVSEVFVFVCFLSKVIHNHEKKNIQNSSNILIKYKNNSEVIENENSFKGHI